MYEEDLFVVVKAILISPEISFDHEQHQADLPFDSDFSWHQTSPDLLDGSSLPSRKDSDNIH